MKLHGLVVNLLIFVSSDLSAVESKAFRKVVVKEIPFSVGARDLPSNVSVKNGVDNETNAPDTRLFQASLTEDAENENKLLKQYYERLRKDPFYSGDVKTKEANSGLKETVKIDSRIKTVDKDNSYMNADRANNGNIKNDKNRKYLDKKENITGHSEMLYDDASKVDQKEPTLKIVGGTLSLPTTWPWQVSIQYYGADNFWHHFCGGSLIHDRWVVTAAHCVCKLEDYTIRVVLGDYRLSVRTLREQVIDPARILMHAYYEDTSYYFDIAMIKLAENALITSNVEAVEMATPEIDTFSANDVCYITGWGNTIGTTERNYMSDFLLQSQVSVVIKSACRQIYGHIIEDTQICITDENASACSGDSGGPLVCKVGDRWKLTGIASWVGSDTCSTEYPNVYTRMSAFAEWATSVVEQY